MPVRNMLYDAMQYEKQVRDLAKTHRREHDAQTSEEYLSGMKKDDRLTPAINFGDKKWDGPLTLREMYAPQPDRILALVPDYRVLLIDPMQMEDKDLARLNSSLREVLAYIKYQHDKRQMQRLITEDERFSRLERNAAMVINAVTNAGISIEPDSEVVNVCDAIQQMINDGITQGEKMGELRGEKQGRLNENLTIARRMIENRFPEETVVSMTRLSPEEVRELRRTMKN